MNRRTFLATTAVGAAGLAVSASARGWQGAAGGQRAPVIDGLGELHLDYEPALLDEMRASGMRGCVVTVGNPALHGPEAFDDMKAEIEAYDAHVARNPDRLARATGTADLDRAAAAGTIGLVDYLDHVDHAVRVAGVEHVGIGSDREHRRIPDTEEEKQKLIEELSRLRPVTAATFRWPFFIAELNHPRRMETIAEGLARRGYPAADIDRILGLNFLRLFRETIG